jgi:hypothetical protein
MFFHVKSKFMKNFLDCLDVFEQIARGSAPELIARGGTLKYQACKI